MEADLTLFFKQLCYNSATMPSPEASNHPESQPIQNHGGEPIGIPSPDRTERPQHRMVKLFRTVRRSDLPVYQEAADALTQAGLGTHSYTIAEHQIIPFTGKLLGEDSPFVIATYSGQANRELLLSLVDRAVDAKQKAERVGKPQEEVDQAVQNTIRTRIASELQRGSSIDTSPRKSHNNF
jgi:hypothetical protein